METRTFEPAILKWARERRFGPKFETLSSNWMKSWTECSPDLIKEWEAGLSQPTFTQVKKLAEIYKRPLAVFFLDDPPEEKQTPPDLRTINSAVNKELSPDALLLIRQARRIQSVAADLSAELGETPSFKYRQHSLEEDPATLGERVRADLGVSIHEQYSAKKFEEFFEYLRAKLEATGIVTVKSGLHDSFPIADCRAFSFADQLPYLILVNNKDFEGAKTFSLAHEFAHILLRRAGICNDFSSFGAGRTVSPVEVFCNSFAASFLVPGSDLLKHKALRGRDKIAPEDVDSLTEQLALDFKVSRIVILRRLLVLGLIQQALYSAKARAWGEETPVRRKDGGSFSLGTVLRKNGRAFSSLVIEAYQKNKISAAGASDYLGLKSRYLNSIKQLVQSHGTE